ncbi:MAG: hypothetical protein B6A08_18580 [Sorangiineae bacterium NIC37A_2]|nr:MAG: hypothetical protein B6A08_18580 [Sorangiineae bacterium NIC37A_2]
MTARISQKTRRALAITAAALFFLYLAYVGFVYVALQRGALTKLTEDVDDFKVDVSGGYSLWPGRVVLNDARLRFKDYNIEVAIEARQLRLNLELLPLFWKTIELSQFEAVDARYKMLHRVKDGQKNRERLAAFPDIGFPRPKVYDTPKPPYGIPPFKIRVPNIVGNVVEAWILEYRAIGEFEARGGFELHEYVTVFPSQVTMKNTTISVGKKELARDAECILSAAIGPFPGREDLGKVVPVVDGGARCTMDLSDISALHVYMPDSELVFLGQGKVKTDLHLKKGQVRSSSLSADLDLQKLGLEDTYLKGKGLFALDANASGAMELGLDLRGDGSKESGLALDQAKARLWLEHEDLTQAELVKTALELKQANLREPSFLRRALGESGIPLLRVENTNANLDWVMTREGHPGKLDARAQGALALFPKPGGAVGCSYQVVVDCAAEGDKQDCAGSGVTCGPLTFTQGTKRMASLQAELRAEKLELGRDEATSAWVLQGDNPKELLQATLANDVWSSLGLALLPLGQIDVKARVNRKKETIAGTVDSFQAGLLSGRGGFITADSFVSRWLVNTPVGRFAISQGEGGAQVQPFPPSDWDVLAF